MEKYYIIPKQLLDDVYNYMVKSPTGDYPFIKVNEMIMALQQLPEAKKKEKEPGEEV